MQEAKLFLASLLRISVDDLEEALGATYRYVQYPKEKSSGGYRIISVPPEPLRKVQRRILRKILYWIPLESRFFGGRVFHGFCRKRSIVTNAHWHKERKATYVLRLDLENSFDNVHSEHFREFFRIFLHDLKLLRDWRRNRYAEARHHRYDRHFYDSRCPSCSLIDKQERDLSRAASVDLRDLRLGMVRFMRYRSEEKYVLLYREWLRKKDSPVPTHPILPVSFNQLPLFPEPLSLVIVASTPKAEPTQKTMLNFPTLLQNVFYLLERLCFHNGTLPQGTPTSPYLLNLAICLSGLPKRLTELSDTLGALKALKEGKDPSTPSWLSSDGYDPLFITTFYADDITFSSRYSFNERPCVSMDQRTVKEMIVAVIEENGRFKVNRRKIACFNQHKEHPLVTGLRLTPKGVVLPKKRVRWLRSFFYHAVRDKKLQSKLAGHLAFLKMVYGDHLPRQLRIKS